MNDIVAFVVGIEHYDQPGWDLAGPCTNAVAIAAWLRSIGVPAGNIHLFLAPVRDHEIGLSESIPVGVRVLPASFTEIDTFWRKDLPVLDTPGSRLLVYWSGHGFTANDGSRVFICRDYTSTYLKNRVFNCTNTLRHLRSPDFGRYREQLILADVCAVYTGLEFAADKCPPRKMVNTARQVAYFATPEGQYAMGNNGRGVFTDICLGVLSQSGEWPGPETFARALRDACSRVGQTPFRFGGFDGEREDPDRLAGTIAADAGSNLFQSVWTLLSSLPLPDSVFRPHYLRTVSSLGIPELAAAQGLFGMIHELASLCDPVGTTDVPYGVIEFLVRLSSEAELADPLDTWLDENAVSRRNALANARARIEREGQEKVLLVELHNDAQGEISFCEPSLRSRDLLPVAGIQLQSAPVAGWEAFKALLQTILETVRSAHAISDFQVHFLVDPPLFDKPFHSIPIGDVTLGEQFVVVVRYRERLRRPTSPVRRCWCEYAEALRGSPPCQVKVLPIPGPGSGVAEAASDARGLCYARFTVPPDVECIKEKRALMNLLRSGAAYLSWLHQPPPADDWGQIEVCLTGCLGTIKTLDRFPEAFTQRRIIGYAAAQQATLLWDDPEFNPFLTPRGIRIL